MEEREDSITSNAVENLTDSNQVVEESEESVKEDDSKNNDPYAYLDRNGFTSEKFKIEIRNLPKYYGIKELKKLLNEKLKLNSTKIKVPAHRSSWIYVCFQSEVEKLHALEVLNEYEWKGFCLKAEKAKPIPDPLVQKRICSLNETTSESKKIKLDEKPLGERVKDATTPLWKIPYPHQLEKKTKLITNLLLEFGKKLTSTNPELSTWWKVQKAKYNGLPCEIHPIRYSELTDGYRNKCEFSIGINEETGEKTIGFRLGSYVQGSTSIAPIEEVPNVPKEMKFAVKTFEKFIRNSRYDVFNSELHQGYWRQLTARYGFRTNQLMLIVGLDPQELTPEDLTCLKNQIKEYFTEGGGKSCRVNSLYLQLMKRKKFQEENFSHDHVFGETFITEQVLGKTFRISPQAFFQVNTAATEILYESIAEVAGLKESVTLLDVCCGTGSIGICLSEKCGEVLGVEISPEAVADAKANAEANNVRNAAFFAGKAEEVLGCVARRASKPEIVAVVDPPRPGLNRDALIQIRKNENVKKLVYVSCDPKRALKNFIDLGRATSKIYRNDPFLPVRAIPIDLFPHTNHCELLIYFERQTET